MKQATAAWLDRALDDLKASAYLLNDSQLTNVVSFHAQQAVEKSFKALIEEYDLGLVKTHNLNRLNAVVKPHCDVIQDMDILEQLDAIYTESRYPGEMGLLPFGKPSLEEAKQFYNFAKAVFEKTRLVLESKSYSSDSSDPT